MFSKVKYISFLPAAVILPVFACTGFSVCASDVKSGTIGNNIEWSISENIMTVSGQGEMENVRYQSYASYSADIDEIIIEEGVASIGNSAFSDFSSLKKVHLPETLESVGINAFSNCSYLSEINIPDRVSYIGNNAFYQTAFISGINEKYIIIGNGILYDYKGNDSEIEIPEGVKSVSDRAFVSDKNIKSVYVPSSVKIIGAGAFLDCSALEYAVVPENVDSIGNNAFGYVLNPAPEVSSSFILYGFMGSEAETYAENNSIEFEIMGDADGDNIVNSYDALSVLCHIANSYEIDSRYIIASDMDMDREITSYDALMILQKVVGL